MYNIQCIQYALPITFNIDFCVYIFSRLILEKKTEIYNKMKCDEDSNCASKKSSFLIILF